MLSLDFYSTFSMDSFFSLMSGSSGDSVSGLRLLHILFCFFGLPGPLLKSEESFFIAEGTPLLVADFRIQDRLGRERAMGLTSVTSLQIGEKQPSTSSSELSLIELSSGSDSQNLLALVLLFFLLPMTGCLKGCCLIVLVRFSGSISLLLGSPLILIT